MKVFRNNGGFFGESREKEIFPHFVGFCGREGRGRERHFTITATTADRTV
jgi:hypothetical protein